MSDVEETFPVHPSDRHLMESVPWDWLAKYQRQVERNHGQTLQRLAQRGGLSIEEIRCAIAGERLFLRTVDKSKSHAAICGAITSWRAMRDAFAKAKETTPKPDPSPVCVEVKELEWLYNKGAGDWSGGRGLMWYQVRQLDDGEARELGIDSGWEVSDGTFPMCPGETDIPGMDLDKVYPTLEAAKAACQADFERRTLELINARSVESVKAEARAEYEAELREASTTWHKAAASLTEGEG